MPQTEQYKAVIFLDRDGVINEDRGYVHSFEDFALLPGVVDALRLLQEWNCCVLVVSNQSGIARGLYTQADLDRLQAEIEKFFDALCVRVQGFYYCPDLDSPNRKPQPGMLKQALRDHFGTEDVPLPKFMIGDKLSDMQAGKALGCHCILIPNAQYPVDPADMHYADTQTSNLKEALAEIESVLAGQST